MLRPGPPLNLARAVARVQRQRPTAATPRVAAAGAPEGRTELGERRTEVPGATPGFGRRRLWDLPPRALDMALGVGLPHEALRRVARRVLRAEPLAQGHTLHAGLVTECRRRGPMAEALQQALAREHAATLRQAAAADTPDALATWWQAQGARGEVAGALWAVLSHPRCTEALQERVLGEVQMLQFQAGRAARVELARFEALIDENAVLGRALAAAQRRCSQMAAEHARERAAWQAEAALLRGRLAALDSARAGLAAAAAPEPQKLERQAARIAALEAALQQALAAAKAQPAQPAQPERLERPVQAAVAAASVATEPPPAPLPVPLEQRNVLCVGGRTAIVPVYRRLIEAQGGRFLHHDGGEEDKLGALDATLAAADLVICQAGCVSHNAYWRVKDHCKRTGKRCVFVETPSAAGLQRALASIGC